MYLCSASSAGSLLHTVRCSFVKRTCSSDFSFRLPFVWLDQLLAHRVAMYLLSSLSRTKLLFTYTAFDSSGCYTVSAIISADLCMTLQPPDHVVESQVCLGLHVAPCSC